MKFLEIIAALFITGAVIGIMLFGGIIATLLQFVGGIAIIFMIVLIGIKEMRDRGKPQ
jgi:uncharacterized membrane protein YhaH (DUF805 family)